MPATPEVAIGATVEAEMTVPFDTGTGTTAVTLVDGRGTIAETSEEEAEE